MVEGEMKELSESVLVDALLFAHEAVQPLLDLQEKLRAAAGKPKRAFTPPSKDEALFARVKEHGLEQGQATPCRCARSTPATVRSTRSAPRWWRRCAARAGDYVGREKEVGEAVGAVKKEFARTPDPRDPHPHRRPQARRDPRRSRARSASCPGPTARRCSPAARPRRWWRSRSAPATTSSGSTPCSASRRSRSCLHYNFPPFSTGEVKMVAVTSRREVGHGTLASRSVAAGAAQPRRLPLHHPHRVRDPRVQRLVVDGHGVRRRRWR